MQAHTFLRLKKGACQTNKYQILLLCFIFLATFIGSGRSRARFVTVLFGKTETAQ